MNPVDLAGATPYRNIDVDESEDAVSAGPARIYSVHAMNMSSGVRYLHLYNATPANVTVGTTTPTLTFPLPTQGDTNGSGFYATFPNGMKFDTAVTVAATTTIGGDDAPGANEIVVNIGYGGR